MAQSEGVVALRDTIVCAAKPDPTAGTRLDEAREWVAAFSERPDDLGRFEATLPVVDIADPDRLLDTLTADTPIFRGSDRRIYVRPPRLLRFVNREFGQRTTAQDLGRRLARLGFSRPRNAEGKLAARDDDGRAVSRRFLASPPGWQR